MKLRAFYAKIINKCFKESDLFTKFFSIFTKEELEIMGGGGGGIAEKKDARGGGGGGIPRFGNAGTNEWLLMEFVSFWAVDLTIFI